jgi:hypothetical protein
LSFRCRGGDGSEGGGAGGGGGAQGGGTEGGLAGTAGAVSGAGTEGTEGGDSVEEGRIEMAGWAVEVAAAVTEVYGRAVEDEWPHCGVAQW